MSKIRLGSPVRIDDGLAFLDEEDRYKSIYCIGSTGSGKTNFFKFLAEHSLDSANIILDPHGGLANQIASISPPDRLVYVDYNHPLVINPLKKNIPKSQRVNEFIQVLNAVISASYSNVEATTRMANILRNIIRVIPDKNLEIDYIYRFLLSDKEREKYRHDAFWFAYDDSDGRFLKKRAAELNTTGGNIADRLSIFQDDHLSQFVKGDNQFNVDEIVRDKKIVVFDLRGFDEEVMRWVGLMVTHAVKTYVSNQAQEDGDPLFFYIDQFQDFITTFGFDRLLVDCRKFKVCIAFSHHSHSQIDKKILDIAMQSHTKVVLTCDYNSADRMAKEMHVKTDDLVKLDKYEAYVSIGKNVHKVSLFKADETRPYVRNAVPNFLRAGWFPA